MTEAEKELLLRVALPTLVYEAIRFADFAAGEGLCAPEDQIVARDPDVFLMEFSNATGDDWEGLAERARDLIARVLREAAEGWRPIETAPKDGTYFLAGWPNEPHPTFCHWQSGLDGRPEGWRSFIYIWRHDDPRGPTHWLPLPPPPATETTTTEEPRHD